MSTSLMPRLRLTKFILTITIVLLACTPLLASWINFVTNYSRSQYHAGSQNWQVTQHNNNWMYFANKMGLLEYTGQHWNLYPANNHSDVRSILKSADNQRIYMGAANEIGYVSPNATGKLEYHCLTCALPKEQVCFGSIWDIQEIGNAVYFMAEQSVIKYCDSSFTFIEAPDKIDCSNQIDGVLYLGTISGIYTLIGEKFFKLPHSEALNDQKIKAILPFQNKVLVATATKGLFMVDGQGVVPFHTEVDAFIHQNELFSMAVSEEAVAIGTILKGVALINDQGKLIKYFNESHGLQNNTVLSLYFDKSRNLWMGLDNGIASISLNSSITELYRAPHSYGAGYASALYKGRLYLGTNQGLYSLPWPIQQSINSPTLELVQPMQGQVWDLQVIGDDLFCSLDKRLFILSGGRVREVPTIHGVWSCRQSLKDRSKVWVSTYHGVYVLYKEADGSWGKPMAVEGFKGSLIDIEEDMLGRLWGKTPQGEVYSLQADSSMTNIVQIVNQTIAHQLPYCNQLVKIEGALLMATAQGTYTYNNGVLEPYKLQPNKPNAYLSVAYNNNMIWLLEQAQMQRFERGGQHVFAQQHNLALISNFERIYPLDDSMAIVPNENGFALWNSCYLPLLTPNNQLQIVSVSLTQPVDTIIYQANFSGMRTCPSIAFNSAITFLYNMSGMDLMGDVQYRVRMDQEPWSAGSTAQAKTYSNLSIGQHTFTVESVVNGERLTDSFTFSVCPPWYRTNMAYIIYMLLMAGMVVGLWYLDKLRMSLNKQQMELRQRKEMWRQEQLFKADAAQKEAEIVKLQNEQLEMEVKHKSQELANIAIILARKNETLSTIKHELSKLKREKDPSEHQRQLIRINNEIDEGMQHDDSLARFEEYFDAVHSNFIQRLNARFPGLTLTEKKMCAFVKMELSTKEMAPLLNLSIRGVESIRYRLRKRFDLNNRDENLFDFLNGI